MEIKYGQNLGDGAFLLHFGTKSPYFPRFSKRVSSSNLDTNPCRAPPAWCPEWSRADRYPGHHRDPGRIGGRASHLARPEMANHAIAAGEDVVGRRFGIVLADIVARVVAGKIRIDFCATSSRALSWPRSAER